MTSSPPRYDVAVVGLGLIGSAALRHLAVRGVRCVGIGPDEPEDFASHDGVFASHYDSGRITRMLDTRPQWALLAQRAIANYAEIEAASGITFHRPTGLIYVVKQTATAASLRATAERLAIAHRSGPIDSFDVDRRLHLVADSTVFVEPAPAGHIDPRRMRTAQLSIATRAGATVLRRRSVSAAPRAVGSGRGWRVQLDDGTTCEAERVLITAGPHADEWIAPWGRLAVVVNNEAVITASLGAEEQKRLAGLPAVIGDVEDPATDSAYMVPPTEYPDGTVRIKLGAQLDGWRDLDTGEARRRWMRGDEHLEQKVPLRRLLTSLVPGLTAEMWATKPCLIPHTPSGLPYVDHLDDGLVVASGCNGYAAKSADAIGTLAAGLVLEGRWTDAELEASDFRLQFAGR